MNYAQNQIKSQYADNQINAFAQQAQLGGSIPVEAPLLTQEFDRITSAVCDLENQLDWLIKKIQPICQAVGSGVTAGISVGADKQEAQPSEMRQTLIHLRNRIDGLTYRISGIKYTIEV